MQSQISIVCNYEGKTYDIVIPTDISADKLISTLSLTFRPKKTVPPFLRCDNPITLLSGLMVVSDFGLHEGSIIYI